MLINPTHYIIAAYTIGFGLLWGYAALMWIETRAVAARTAQSDRNNAGDQP